MSSEGDSSSVLTSVGGSSGAGAGWLGCVADAGCDAGCDDPALESTDEGSVVKLMRYWKPWQPPDVTVMRSARSGLDSVRIRWASRDEARGEMESFISVVGSSGWVRGLERVVVVGMEVGEAGAGCDGGGVVVDVEVVEGVGVE